MVDGWNPFFFQNTGFTSSTFPIQPDFSQNQPAAITLINTGSPRTLLGRLSLGPPHGWGVEFIHKDNWTYIVLTGREDSNTFIHDPPVGWNIHLVCWWEDSPPAAVAGVKRSSIHKAQQDTKPCSCQMKGNPTFFHVTIWFQGWKYVHHPSPSVGCKAANPSGAWCPEVDIHPNERFTVRNLA